MAGKDETSNDTAKVNSKEKTKKREESSDEYAIVPPDGGFAWVVTAACFMTILISEGILCSFGLILSELERVFCQPVAKVAWIFSLVNGISLIAGPIASALSNRFGFRAVVIAGSLLGFVGLLTSSFAQSVDVLFVTLGLIFGIAVGLVFTPVVVGVGFYFDKRRALATGITVCGSGAGTFVFAPLTHWLLETYALGGTFLILSALYLNCVVFGSFLIPLKPQRRNCAPEGDKQIQADVIGAQIGKSTTDDVQESKISCENGKVIEQFEREPLTNTEFSQKKNEEKKKLSRRQYLSTIFKFSLFRSPSFVVICISSFFQSLGWFVPYVYLAAHAVNVGIPKDSASFLLSIIGICSMIGRILNGLLSDHPKVSVLLLNNVGLSLGGLLMILCPFLSSYEMLVICSIPLGLALSTIAVTRPILLGELLGLENVTNAYGFMLVFYGVAGLFGTPLAGLLYDTLGDYYSAFYLAGSCVLFSAFLCYPLGWINRWEKKRNSKMLNAISQL